MQPYSKNHLNYIIFNQNIGQLPFLRVILVALCDISWVC